MTFLPTRRFSIGILVLFIYFPCIWWSGVLHWVLWVASDCQISGNRLTHFLTHTGRGGNGYSGYSIKFKPQFSLNKAGKPGKRGCIGYAITGWNPVLGTIQPSGPRGRGFESRHSDLKKSDKPSGLSLFLLVLAAVFPGLTHI